MGENAADSPRQNLDVLHHKISGGLNKNFLLIL